MTRQFIVALALITIATVSAAQTTAPAIQTSTVGTIARSAVEVKPLGKDDHVPQLTLKSADGLPFDLNAALAKQPTVLIFYRGGWCPFCNRQMSGLERIVKDLKDSGYQLLAISPDTPKELAASVKKRSLTYTLLSDSDAAAIKAFGLAFKVDDATVSRYLTMGIDLEKSSGEKHHALPVPAVYLVGKDGTIHFVHYDPDYRKRMDPAKIVEEAKAALPE